LSLLLAQTILLQALAYSLFNSEQHTHDHRFCKQFCDAVMICWNDYKVLQLQARFSEVLLNKKCLKYNAQLLCVCYPQSTF